ncbi:MAG: hypothetical protein M1374_08260 [Firmicutes bacterium]|nr:hypothetical protein [Bacillota bacterium]
MISFRKILLGVGALMATSGGVTAALVSSSGATQVAGNVESYPQSGVIEVCTKFTSSGQIVPLTSPSSGTVKCYKKPVQPPNPPTTTLTPAQQAQHKLAGKQAYMQAAEMTAKEYGLTLAQGEEFMTNTAYASSVMIKKALQNPNNLRPLPTGIFPGGDPVEFSGLLMASTKTWQTEYDGNYYDVYGGVAQSMLRGGAYTYTAVGIVELTDGFRVGVTGPKIIGIYQDPSLGQYKLMPESYSGMILTLSYPGGTVQFNFVTHSFMNNIRTGNSCTQIGSSGTSSGTQIGSSGTQIGSSGTQTGSSGTSSGTQTGSSGTQTGSSGTQIGSSVTSSGTQTGSSGTSSGTQTGRNCTATTTTSNNGSTTTTN